MPNNYLHKDKGLLIIYLIKDIACPVKKLCLKNYLSEVVVSLTDKLQNWGGNILSRNEMG